MNLGRAEIEFVVENHLGDTNHGGDGFGELNKIDLTAILGLSIERREKSIYTELILEQSLDTGGRRVLIWLLNDLAIVGLFDVIKNGDDLLVDLLNS